MGLDYHEVKLLPYDERWDEQFQTEKSLIEANIISSGFSIEHIGSTAVPGMVAKLLKPT